MRKTIILSSLMWLTCMNGQAQVTLGPGSITLRAGSVEIKNSTTIPIGTTLTIEN